MSLYPPSEADEATLADDVRQAMADTEDMDDPHRYHMLCVKLLSILAAHSAA